ncbi:molybdenum cofactor biosysynthesis protein [Streptomyces sp. NPDC090306]|uniref:molybdenum cofactor biosysynthesis protein n=1 Tax=unclassified Streptomyces TaxID=2593676 RepID=UPI0036E0A0F8
MIGQTGAGGAGATAQVEVLELLVSAHHRLSGRPSDGPASGPDDERVGRVTVRAGLGLVGDRYFGRPAHRDASVTIMAAENLPSDLAPGVGLRHTRRNVLLRGVDVDALVGAVLSLDTGDGPVSFRLNRPARPCAWMDVTVAPGAWRAMRRTGGVRCTPLTDGTLAVGPAELRILQPPPGAPGTS